jgi:hypothetical protein
MDLRRLHDDTWTVWAKRVAVVKDRANGTYFTGSKEMRMTGAQFVRWLHDLKDRDREVHGAIKENNT